MYRAPLGKILTRANSTLRAYVLKEYTFLPQSTYIGTLIKTKVYAIGLHGPLGLFQGVLLVDLARRQVAEFAEGGSALIVLIA